ncbi:MAG: hypothetical protein DRG78_19530 [Epsilonproteobacteria bacterium]|nr:MAG: hypothetical protein DRG78_19530 [Campylobacterota bacterium]
MTPSVNIQSSSYYDFIADSYDELYKEEQLEKVKIVRTLIKPRPKHWLLDIGSGTGLSSCSFKCYKVGIDPSLKLILRSRILSILGQAEHLPFPNHSFDYIISLTAIQNFKDIDKALRECKRVAKPNAKVVISCLKKSRKLHHISTLLTYYFKVLIKVEQDKDIIWLLKPK